MRGLGAQNEQCATQLPEAEICNVGPACWTGCLSSIGETVYTCQEKYFILVNRRFRLSYSSEFLVGKSQSDNRNGGGPHAGMLVSRK